MTVTDASPDVPTLAALLARIDETKVDGGFVVSGRWPWASGSWHADWALVGILVPDEAGEVVDQALAFIPLLTLVLAGPQLGLGRAALRYVIDRAPRRGIAYTKFERQADSTAFQLQIARAATLIDTAHLHAFRAAGDIDDAAARGEKLPYLARARVRADTAHAITQVRHAIDDLLSAHGASSFADASPLQRIWRDSATAGRHAVADPLVNQEVYGKALLGIPHEENITPLI